jgi:hypothetical protein
LPTASLGIRPGCAVAADIAAVATFTLPDLPPLHRLRPRRPLPRRHCCRRFGLEVPTSKSRSDLTVSHGLAGLLRRSPRSRGTLRCCQRRIHGLVASRYRSWGSLRFAIVVRVAPAPHTGHLAMVCVQPVTRTPRPRSAVRTLWRIPPIRSRVVSPRSLPPWCSLPAQPRSIRRDRYRLRRSCHDHVMQHLRGVAPQMGPYQQPPFPAALWPTLPGLWSPSRSFDPGIAPEADASRTQCTGIPAIRFRSSFAAASDLSVSASLRSAPASSSLAVQPFGWGSPRRPWWRGVRRAVCGEAGDGPR